MLSVHTSPLAALGAKKTGGMNVYVRDFSRELGRRGVQVDIFTRKIERDQPDVVSGPGRNCRVIHVPAGPFGNIPNDDLADHLDEFACGVRCFARVQGIRYDLIHSHYWLSGLVADRLRQAWGALPIVHMYHTLGHMKNQIARARDEFASAARIAGETYVAHLADRLVAATPAERKQLLHYYDADPETIVVVPPGVDLERFAGIEKEEARRRIHVPLDQSMILFVGRIEPLKGIDNLLSAISILRDRFPHIAQNVHVAIVGGDPHAAELDAEMRRLQCIHTKLDLHDLVQFWGAKDQSDLPDYYAAADLVVMPSHYESFGMVGLEAMAMGTPVVASRVGGLSHLVEHGGTGFLVPPQTSEALAARIYDLLSNEPLRQHLGDRARARARDYAWPAIVDRMLSVYCDVLAPCYA